VFSCAVWSLSQHRGQHLQRTRSPCRYIPFGTPNRTVGDFLRHNRPGHGGSRATATSTFTSASSLSRMPVGKTNTRSIRHHGCHPRQRRPDGDLPGACTTPHVTTSASMPARRAGEPRHAQVDFRKRDHRLQNVLRFKATTIGATRWGRHGVRYRLRLSHQYTIHGRVHRASDAGSRHLYRYRDDHGDLLSLRPCGLAR